MSKKGSTTTADYIDFEKASSVGQKLLKVDKTKVIGLYILMAINTGLRISDLLTLKFDDVTGEKLKLVEKKTRKNRQIKLNENVRNALNYFQPIGGSGYLFLSQKGGTYTTQSLNRILKDVFKKEARTLNISSHSLRKSFGRKVYENNGESEKALTYLSELFNHSSQRITRQYLGIRQEELNDIYDGLV
jgi:integrase